MYVFQLNEAQEIDGTITLSDDEVQINTKCTVVSVAKEELDNGRTNYIIHYKEVVVTECETKYEGRLCAVNNEQQGVLCKVRFLQLQHSWSYNI